MGVIQITYNDVQNMIEAASKDKPYLVYSYKLRKLPNPSGSNTYYFRNNNHLLYALYFCS
jgi:hypothetical protein